MNMYGRYKIANTTCNESVSFLFIPTLIHQPNMSSLVNKFEYTYVSSGLELQVSYIQDLK